MFFCYQGILITRLPKDCPADVAGMQAGERAAEGSLISEPNTRDAAPTEASSKGSPFQTLNHVITVSTMTTASNKSCLAK